MKNPNLIPYETIVRATNGEPEAVEEVLQHYSKRIRLASLENGHVNTRCWVCLISSPGKDNTEADVISIGSSYIIGCCRYDFVNYFFFLFIKCQQ